MFDWKDLYVLIAAFAGAVIGGIFTLFGINLQNKGLKEQINSSQRIAEKEIQSSTEIALKQINAQVVSANRQNWINTLRDLVSKILSLFELYRIQKTQSFDKSNLLDSELFKEMIETKKEIEFIKTKIVLLLNPTEQASQDVLNAISSLLGKLNTMQPGATNYEAFKEDQNNVVEATQKVLLEEWKRVKKGE